MTEIPAVIVLFADLDWNHPSWDEKVTECESKVSSLRFFLLYWVISLLSQKLTVTLLF